jgi:hypothetical protein
MLLERKEEIEAHALRERKAEIGHVATEGE